ncbi:hypothetical protein IG631_19167 [Alternaria alternata]|nr:hypothetical protein IG631_19167 [Alternaria alternata]
MPDPVDIYDDYGSGPSMEISRTEHEAMKKWKHRVAAAMQISNEWALLDALGDVLTFDWYQGAGIYCEDIEISENVTFTQDCLPIGYDGNGLRNNTGEIKSDLEPLRGTVFDQKRFGSSGKELAGDSEFYHPTPRINITEDLLNSVLTNFILSAMSLGKWWDVMPVTITRYKGTYSFANPLNLILPYSICLAAAAAFAAIAIWSLSRNGTPAVDGSFLQIMTATRGNTEMERLVLREKLTTVENMSVELKALKVWYGELVGEDVVGGDGRPMGFGTIEGTISLRKRK